MTDIYLTINAVSILFPVRASSRTPCPADANNSHITNCHTNKMQEPSIRPAKAYSPTEPAEQDTCTEFRRRKGSNMITWAATYRLVMSWRYTGTEVQLHPFLLSAPAYCQRAALPRHTINTRPGGGDHSPNGFELQTNDCVTTVRTTECVDFSGAKCFGISGMLGVWR